MSAHSLAVIAPNECSLIRVRQRVANPINARCHHLQRTSVASSCGAGARSGPANLHNLTRQRMATAQISQRLDRAGEYLVARGRLEDAPPAHWSWSDTGFTQKELGRAAGPEFECQGNRCMVRR